MENLEKYFEKFRNEIVGIDKIFQSPYGEKKIIYADWIASGRLFKPIEVKMLNEFGPFIGNTHSEASETGTLMTQSYHYALKLIKRHVNAGENDVIITTGTGMTAAINKFQRILGLRIPEQLRFLYEINPLPDEEKPIIFITHMEHHSNHTPWLETIADVKVLEPDENLQVSPDELRKQLERYKYRKIKLGSFSACSNVTGVKSNYHELAKIMHEYHGYCFVDFAASAPYMNIDMHPKDDPTTSLDAIFFSPHKFLGGPGTSGVLIFNAELYRNKTPDQPGGGTVTWTNRWGQYHYLDDIEAREDGGTPGFLQAIRIALCIQIKEKMGVENIHQREKELLKIAFEKMRNIPGLKILANESEDRLGVISFYIEKIHYNLIVRLLNDRFGIQVRGGCSCAGTYGHYLLNVDFYKSQAITEKINLGDLSEKPGWVRLSLHPTMTDKELYFIIDAINQVAINHLEWQKDYTFSRHTAEFYHQSFPRWNESNAAKLFSI